MNRNEPRIDRTLHSRFECKYVVDPLLIPEIRRYIEPFAESDRFAALHEDRRYPICSLYLDTEDLRLYMQTVGGEKNRFKLRVRSYSDDPATPVFFEVKKKVDRVVHKVRGRLDRKQAKAFLTKGSAGLSREAGKPDAELSEFENYVSLIAAKPALRVKYIREPYESKGGDPVRITFDSQLQHAITLDDKLWHDQGRWNTTPLEGTIIEIKFTGLFPPWVNDVVQRFGLKQQPVPKYIMCMDHALEEGRWSSATIAGSTLPPGYLDM
jgi:hypothetical protein